VGRTCSIHRGDEKLFKILIRKSEVKRPLTRPRCRWDDNIRMDLKSIGWEGVD
jgi:hypothetical protein